MKVGNVSVVIMVLVMCSCSNKGKDEFNFLYTKENIQVSVARKGRGEPWRILVIHKTPPGYRLPVHPEFGDTLRHSMLVFSLQDGSGNRIAGDTNVATIPNVGENSENPYFRDLESMSRNGKISGYNRGRESRHAFFIKPDPKIRGWIDSKLNLDLYLYSVHTSYKTGHREVYTRVSTRKPWISLTFPMYVRF
jgi:hypothetical protein